MTNTDNTKTFIIKVLNKFITQITFIKKIYEKISFTHYTGISF